MDASTATTSKPTEWAKVELMGHRTRCGAVSEVERFGAKLLRIDVYRPDADTPCLTEFYSGSAIFSFTPCTEELARRWAENRWNLPEEVRLALPAPTEAERADADVHDADFREVPDADF